MLRRCKDIKLAAVLLKTGCVCVSVMSFSVIGLGLSGFAQAQNAPAKIIDGAAGLFDDLKSVKPEIIPSGRVKRVISGNSLELDSGLKVRLAGITAPRQNRDSLSPRSASDQSSADRSLFEQARLALEDRVKGRDIGLAYIGPQRDRYSRAIAQVFVLDDGGKREVWLQEEMVLAGFARVYSWAESVFRTDYLYEAEQEARNAGRGIWKEGGAFKIRSPDPNTLAQHVDSFQIVEGIIISAADVRGRVYLNFGSDYKTDFTVTIAKKHRKKFDAAGLDLLSLEGARIRVRVWVELYNGPVIWIDHPERIEMLDG